MASSILQLSTLEDNHVWTIDVSVYVKQNVKYLIITLDNFLRWYGITLLLLQQEEGTQQQQQTSSRPAAEVDDDDDDDDSRTTF